MLNLEKLDLKDTGIFNRLLELIHIEHQLYIIRLLICSLLSCYTRLGR